MERRSTWVGSAKAGLPSNAQGNSETGRNCPWFAIKTRGRSDLTTASPPLRPRQVIHPLPNGGKMTPAMQWDDELQALVLDILKYFDEQALSDAANRALATASRRSRSVDASLATDVAGTPATVVPSFEECLRTELRRMLRPH